MQKPGIICALMYTNKQFPFLKRKLQFSPHVQYTTALWSVNPIFPHQAPVNERILQMSTKMKIFTVTIKQFLFYLWPSRTN